MDDKVLYYVNLLTMQYFNKPKARGTIAAFVTINNIQELLAQIKNRLDVNNLSSNFILLSKILGIRDIYSGLSVKRKAFGYISYTQTTSWTGEGYITYATSSDSIYMTYSGIDYYNYDLTVPEMQLICKLKISKNSLYASLKNIDDFFIKYIPEIYVDISGLMKLKYFIPKSQKNIFNILNDKNLLLKNAGEQIVFEYI